MAQSISWWNEFKGKPIYTLTGAAIDRHYRPSPSTIEDGGISTLFLERSFNLRVFSKRNEKPGPGNLDPAYIVESIEIEAFNSHFHVCMKRSGFRCYGCGAKIEQGDRYGIAGLGSQGRFCSHCLKEVG